MKAPLPDPFEVAKPVEKLSSQPIRWNPAEQCFFVTYNSHTMGRLRCIPKEFALNPMTMLSFFFLSPLVFTWINGTNWPLAMKIVLSLVGSFCAMLAVVVIQIVASRNRPPAHIKIVQGGLVDEMSHKTGTYNWRDIRKAKNWDGDLFFLVQWPQGCYFCREAFRTRAEADAFFSIVERLSQSNGAEWDNVVRQYAPRA